ncbi:ABC transporter permease [Streptomyces sp. NPDC051561]|uniref:ABC transporter permease n=1 Tax=Streptomyces sp. NPDC051561 TaxID=3365658 RepID=UPI0037A44D52
MTAPLTPPHQPSPHDPWQTPAAHGDGATYDKASSGGGSDIGDPDLLTEIRRGAVVMLVLAAAGLLLGLLWAWLAPKVGLVSTDKAVFLKDTEGEEAAGADSVFVLLGIGFGLISGAVVFWLYRRGGIPLVIALLLGGLLGSVAGWLTGAWWFGPSSDVVAQAKSVGVGVTFDAPLKLQALGALLAWPFVAVLVHLGLTAVWGVRDPEPEWGYFGVEPGAYADLPAGPGVQGAQRDEEPGGRVDPGQGGGSGASSR